MSEIEDGGPAFPTPCDRFGDHSVSMSLRDWFAGQAVQGIVVTKDRVALAEHTTTVARLAYAVADAMIAERKKERPK